MARKAKVYLTRTCITSRRTVGYLKTKGFNVEEIDYYKVRLTKDEISKLLKLARVAPKEALRKKDRVYKELNLANNELLMAKYWD